MHRIAWARSRQSGGRGIGRRQGNCGRQKFRRWRSSVQHMNAGGGAILVGGKRLVVAQAEADHQGV